MSLHSPVRMRTSTRRAALASAALVGLSLAADAGAQSADRRTLSGDAAVYNVAGTVRVVPGTGRVVVVDVLRRGRDGTQLRVEQGEVAGRQAIRIVYPDDDIVYPVLGSRSRIRTRIRSDGSFHDTHAGFFSGREITVRGSGSGTEAWADLTVAIPAGQRLAVHLIAGDAIVSNVDGDLRLDVDAANVSTERTRGRLSIDAGSGRVQLVAARGAVDLDVGSGSIDLRDIDADDLRVDGGSGSLVGQNVAARSVDLDMGSGSTRLTKVNAPSLRLDSGSGASDIEFVSDVELVRVDAGSGPVTLRLPAAAGAAVDIDSGSGSIESELPLQIRRREHDRLIGQIGDGRGRIEVDGGSGTIRLKKTS